MSCKYGVVGVCWLRLLICFSCLFVATQPSYAAVTTIQALSFGEFVVKDNAAQYNITINTNGTYTFDSAGFIELSNPQEGVFDLDGMTPSTAIVSVVITQIVPLSGAGESFQMINFQETHPGSTDGSGVARITVGGTARTSGNGTSYVDQTLSGTVQIQINF